MPTSVGMGHWGRTDGPLSPCCNSASLGGVSFRLEHFDLRVVASLLTISASSAFAMAEPCNEAMVKGQKLRDAGTFLQARASFANCAVESCEEALRQFCSDSLVELDKQIPSIVLAARDGEGHDLVDVRVTVDGVVMATKLDGKPIPVDPGSHTIRFETGPNSLIELKIVAQAGEKSRTVRAEFPATRAPSRSMPIGGWILGGVSLGALGVGTFFALQGLGRISTHEAEPCATTKSCDVSDVRRSFNLADGFFALSVLSLGGAAIAYFTSTPSPPKHGLAGSVIATTGGFRFQLGGTF